MLVFFKNICCFLDENFPRFQVQGTQINKLVTAKEVQQILICGIMSARCHKYFFKDMI
jgi:nicotinamidase-related amidase